MCLITLAWQAHPHFPLVLAANRDEFHDRPAAAADWWPDAPGVFGGRDLSQGGSWLAVSRQHRLAAITNVRRMVPPDLSAPSRGRLVAEFVRGEQSALDYARQLAEEGRRYAGFNLLLFDGGAPLYVTNVPAPRHVAIGPGVHGVSNAALDTPWPKLLRLKQGMHDWIAQRTHDHAPLVQLLSDTRPAADAELPDTGVGLELERFLSPPFIRGPRYGTRCSSIVTVDRQGLLRFRERRYGPDGSVVGECDESFGA